MAAVTCHDVNWLCVGFFHLGAVRRMDLPRLSIFVIAMLVGKLSGTYDAGSKNQSNGRRRDQYLDEIPTILSIVRHEEVITGY